MVFQGNNSEIPEDVDKYLMLSDQDKKDIIVNLNDIASEVGTTPFEELSEFQNVRNAKEIERLFDQYSAEAVWDTLIYYEAEHLYEEEDSESEPPFCSDYHQLQHMLDVKAEEKDPDNKLPQNTFGLYAPSYGLALQEVIPELSEKKDLRAMLLGTFGPTSAQEFDDFMHEINPESHNSVIDLSRVGLSLINRDMGIVQGDVTRLPVQDKSLDLIFTNFLIPYLYKGQGPFPKGKNIVKMIEESNRALKDNGKLILCEHTYAFGVGANYNSLVTTIMYLLLTTLKQNGFGKREVMYSHAYKTHKDKVEKNRNAIEERAERQTNPNGDNVQHGFRFTISAQKTTEKHEVY